MIAHSMETAPKTRNILIKTKIHNWHSGEGWVHIGYSWVECLWAPAAQGRHEGWRRWCGKFEIITTDTIDPVLWADLPVEEA